VLDRHDGPVTCVCFDSDGKRIGSYSNADNSIRIWKVGSTGFFGSILDIGGKYIKKIDVLNKNITDKKVSL